jgi:hypothetical protein
MIKPHAPFQDGSKHAANEYCPTCHGHMDPNIWDSDGKYRAENQYDYFQGNSDRHWYYVFKGTSALEAKGPFMTKTQAIQHSKGIEEVNHD